MKTVSSVVVESFKSERFDARELVLAEQSPESEANVL